MKKAARFLCLLSFAIAPLSDGTFAQDWNHPLPIGGIQIAIPVQDPVTFGGRGAAVSPSDSPEIGAMAAEITRQPPTVAAPEAKPEATKPKCETCCHGMLIDWSKYPETSQPMQRPGNFFIPYSKGPACFSLWDAVTNDCRETRPKSGYAPFAINPWSFYDADWRFVEGIPCEERTVVERLKRIHLNNCWLLGTGGSYWINYQNQHNSRLTETENDFTLVNFRLYTDLWYRDRFRFYAESIWADNIGSELPPLTPDVDLGDIQCLFVDLKLFVFADKPVYARTGRQELVYGSQRMVTALPWANKRNAFDGIKLFRQGEKWDYDLFWTKFVPAQASQLDREDENQTLAGSWLTYKPKKGTAVDLYYLYYGNQNTVIQQGINQLPAETNTIGGRWSGDNEGRLWDFEGAVQLGDQSNVPLSAGMATAGVGHNWKTKCWNPTAWLYYDYASGDSDPNAGNANTYNQIFPFGHYYLGWTDLVGRQNIHDINAHLYLDPNPWCNVWLQYHHFQLVQSADALYNAGGVAYRRDATGQSGRNVGDEVDIVVNFHLTDYSDLLVSYATLIGGEFLENTAGPNQASDAQSFYMIYSRRF